MGPLLRAALLGSGRAARNLFGKCDVAKPTGFLHVSRAKVGARDATGTNGEAPRHPPLQAKSWPAAGTGTGRQAGCGKFLEARRAGRKHAGGTVPSPAETWLPALPVSIGQQQQDSRQRAARSHGTPVRAVSACTPGFAIAPSSCKSPAVLRTTHGQRTRIWARGTLLSLSAPG